MRTLTLLLFICFLQTSFHPPEKIFSYTADPQKQNIALYWKNDHGKVMGNAQSLKKHLESKEKKLVFCMNAGMYKTDQSPQGLFIQEGKETAPLDKGSGSGNFYMKPNGVFYITKDKKAVVCRSSDVPEENIEYATQSGPMLLINGALHPAFKMGSANLHIRNAVGILPDGQVLFAISREPINFYDLAMYFKNAGCQNALYLDGFVSRMYLPEKNILQTDGDFGVMIGVTE